MWFTDIFSSSLTSKANFLDILSFSCQTLVNTRQLKHLVHVNVKFLKDWNLETPDDDDDDDDKF